jgi:hypothetical protein
MRLLLGTGEMEAVRTGMARVSAVIKVGHIPKSGQDRGMHIGTRPSSDYLVGMRATVGVKPRFETLRASLTMLILEKRGRLVIVFPLQSPRKAKATSSSDLRFRAAA